MIQRNEVTMTPEEALNIYRSNLRLALGRMDSSLARMSQALNDWGAAVLDGDDQTWVWADLHLGHENVIGYANRPFVSVDEMDRALWANWQAIVGRKATLICVGDVALSTGVCQETWQRIRAGPGRRKILVIGNHDLTNSGRLRTLGFDEAWALLVSDEDPPLIWTHAPLPHVPNGHVNVHGHLHNESLGGSKHINVSVEQIEYRPLPLKSVRRLAQAIVVGKYPDGSTTLERVRSLEACDRR